MQKRPVLLMSERASEAGEVARGAWWRHRPLMSVEQLRLSRERSAEARQALDQIIRHSLGGCSGRLGLFCRPFCRPRLPALRAKEKGETDGGYGHTSRRNNLTGGSTFAPTLGCADRNGARRPTATRAQMSFFSALKFTAHISTCLRPTVLVRIAADVGVFVNPMALFL